MKKAEGLKPRDLKGLEVSANGVTNLNPGTEL